MALTRPRGTQRLWQGLSGDPRCDSTPAARKDRAGELGPGQGYSLVTPGHGLLSSEQQPPQLL